MWIFLCTLRTPVAVSNMATFNQLDDKCWKYPHKIRLDSWTIVTYSDYTTPNKPATNHHLITHYPLTIIQSSYPFSFSTWIPHFFRNFVEANLALPRSPRGNDGCRAFFARWLTARRPNLDKTRFTPAWLDEWSHACPITPVNCPSKPWKDPPFYSWVNPLCLWPFSIVILNYCIKG